MTKKHTLGQILAKLRDAGVMLDTGKALAAELQALEVSEQTYYRWRNQYGGMKSEEAKRPKELENEISRRKRLLADAELEQTPSCLRAFGKNEGL